MPRWNARASALGVSLGSPRISSQRPADSRKNCPLPRIAEEVRDLRLVATESAMQRRNDCPLKGAPYSSRWEPLQAAPSGDGAICGLLAAAALLGEEALGGDAVRRKDERPGSP